MLLIKASDRICSLFIELSTKIQLVKKQLQNKWNEIFNVTL